MKNPKNTHGGAGRNQGRKKSRPYTAHPVNLEDDLLAVLKHLYGVKGLNAKIRELCEDLCCV